MHLLTKMTSVNCHSSEIFLSAHPGCNTTPPCVAKPVPKPKAVLEFRSVPHLWGLRAPSLVWTCLQVGLTQPQTKVRVVFKGESRNGFSILTIGGHWMQHTSSTNPAYPVSASVTQLPSQLLTSHVGFGHLCTRWLNCTRDLWHLPAPGAMWAEHPQRMLPCDDEKETAEERSEKDAETRGITALC